ncbi:hypothetical protein SBBP2_2880002 [Burkholderiales bacterium]|nr:hypothetical protein SBBP2_2880002 [Burkholderiales bacterium]
MAGSTAQQEIWRHICPIRTQALANDGCPLDPMMVVLFSGFGSDSKSGIFPHRAPCVLILAI